ncbi:MAG: cytidine deaminase [Bacteroidetes bacterium]|nr:cytidine deaminase [Bacteroidota bacterium]MCY4204464.1 cytidine deaminase [Bacteroidota bacterium]
MIESLDTLRHYVQSATSRSFVPYSCQPRAVLALLSDGRWTCGVRIENACYPLVIPALSSALVSAASMGRRDVVAVVFSSSMKEEEKTTALHLVDSSFDQLDDDVLGHVGRTYHLQEKLATCKDLKLRLNPTSGIFLARQAARYAHTPESDFPVGAIVVTEDQKYFQGANIEYPDWRQILCAERAAIAAAISAGAKDIRQIYVSCLKSSKASPCGACRQVLYEVAPNSVIWIDRGEEVAESFRPKDLLPDAFHLSES